MSIEPLNVFILPSLADPLFFINEKENLSLLINNYLLDQINLSFLYYKLNNLEKAQIIIEEAIKLKPSFPNSYCIRGLILKSLNKYSESKTAFKKAIELDSTYVDAYINLGLLNKDYNNLNDAIKYYLKALT